MFTTEKQEGKTKQHMSHIYILVNNSELFAYVSCHTDSIRLFNKSVRNLLYSNKVVI